MARLGRSVRRHPLLVTGAFLFLAAAAAGTWIYLSTFRVEAAVVYYGVPDAPGLEVNRPGEVVYRIDATRSEVSYRVEERLAGATHHATGITKGIAGDIRIDHRHPARTRVGDVVVNVEQLTSDQTLRDERLRTGYLESDRFPLATLHTTSIEGLPDEVADGEEYTVRLRGDLTVRDLTKPVTVGARVTLDGDELAITAHTTVLLSDYGVGPIRMTGFVESGDEAELTFDLVAVDATELPDPAAVATAPVADEATTDPADAPSFADEVQPILEQSCASCHQEGEAGAHAWQLETAGDAQAVAPGLALAVRSRYMPPWPASNRSVPFDHSARLTRDQIEAIGAWADAGAPLDVEATAPVEPPAEHRLHPRADAELRSDTGYVGSTDLPNDYRCIVMDPELDEPTAVTAYEFVPDQAEVVHHALVYKLPGDALPDVEALDEADPGPGYQCFGGVGASSATEGGPRLVMGWAPGQPASFLPDGVAMPLEPGEFYVTQIHYHFGHEAPPDRSTLVLQLDRDHPERYDAAEVTTYLAPAEIPCGPTESGPLCDRDAALDQLDEEYGGARRIADGLHFECGTTVEELSVLDADGIARTSCDHPVRRTGEILSVLGHEHELGHSFRMTLNPDTDDEQVLLDIPRWDFDWQFNYRPSDRIVLEEGDVIRIECSWDRNLVNPASEPRYVTWAEGTEDEMCYSTVVTVAPPEDDPPDGDAVAVD